MMDQKQNPNEIVIDTDWVVYRKYEKVWQAIAAAAKPVRIRVPVGFQKTFRQAIMKEKSKANVRRKELDMPAYGKMQIEVDKKNKEILIFSLAYNGDLL